MIVHQDDKLEQIMFSSFYTLDETLNEEKDQASLKLQVSRILPNITASLQFFLDRLIRQT